MKLEASEVQFAFWIPISSFQNPTFISLAYDVPFPFGFTKMIAFPGIPLDVTLFD